MKYLPFIATFLLFVALIPELPYGYFQFLRIAICAVACFGIWKTHRAKQDTWLFVFTGIAILFNPFLPIYLPKNVWMPIDILVGIFFVVIHKKYACNN